MVDNNIGTTYFRDRSNNNIADVTLENINSIIMEMNTFGITQYFKKHTLKDMIANSITIDDVKGINWTNIL